MSKYVHKKVFNIVWWIECALKDDKETFPLV